MLDQFPCTVDGRTSPSLSTQLIICACSPRHSTQNLQAVTCSKCNCSWHRPNRQIIDRQAQHGVIILLWQARVTKGSNSELWTESVESEQLDSRRRWGCWSCTTQKTFTSCRHYHCTATPVTDCTYVQPGIDSPPKQKQNTTCATCMSHTDQWLFDEEHHQLHVQGCSWLSKSRSAWLKQEWSTLTPMQWQHI